MSSQGETPEKEPRCLFILEGNHRDQEELSLLKGQSSDRIGVRPQGSIENLEKKRQPRKREKKDQNLLTTSGPRGGGSTPQIKKILSWERNQKDRKGERNNVIRGLEAGIWTETTYGKKSNFNRGKGARSSHQKKEKQNRRERKT